MIFRSLVVIPVLGLLAIQGFAQTEQMPKQRPGREVCLSASEVKDTFFAYLLGIIISGVDLDVDNEQLSAILTEFKPTLLVPFSQIIRVGQHIVPGTGERAIGLSFSTDMDIPIPFSVLFYHPGRIITDRSLVFQVRRSTYVDPGSAGGPVAVFDLVLARGGILIDIDDWLEALFRAHLEDTWIQHIVFFKWHGDWIGLLEGTGRRTPRVFRSFFDFTRNSVLFPIPAELDKLGRVLVPDTAPGL